MTQVSISTYLAEVFPQFCIIFSIQSLILYGRIKWLYCLRVIFIATLFSVVFNTAGEIVFGVAMFLLLQYRGRQSAVVSFILMWDFYIIVINLITLLSEAVNIKYFGTASNILTTIINVTLILIIVLKFNSYRSLVEKFLHLLDTDIRVSQIFMAYSMTVCVCLYAIELGSELIQLPFGLQWLVFGVFLALLIVNTGALYFLYGAVTTRTDNQLLHAAAKAKEQYYADIELQQTHTLKILHDYKNVLGALQLSLAQDSVTDTTQTRQLISDATATLTTIQPNNAALTTISTLSLRSLLYLKWTQAHSHDIWLNIQTGGPVALNNHTDVMDSLRIVGILLDNAIEATAAHGTVDILLVPAADELAITVINTVPADFKLAHLNQHGFTTKGATHGNGLTNIRELTHNNHHLHLIKQLLDRKLSITLSIEVD